MDKAHLLVDAEINEGILKHAPCGLGCQKMHAPVSITLWLKMHMRLELVWDLHLDYADDDEKSSLSIDSRDIM